MVLGISTSLVVPLRHGRGKPTRALITSTPSALLSLRLGLTWPLLCVPSFLVAPHPGSLAPCTASSPDFWAYGLIGSLTVSILDWPLLCVPSALQLWMPWATSCFADYGLLRTLVAFRLFLILCRHTCPPLADDWFPDGAAYVWTLSVSNIFLAASSSLLDTYRNPEVAWTPPPLPPGWAQ